MNVRGMGLALLALCLLGGLIAALFTPAIAATLTLPPTPASGQVVPPVGSSPVRKPTVVATEPATLPTMPAGMTVLAQDTFQRPDATLWGNASDGHPWGGDANTNPAFAIVNHAGQISGARGALQATINVTTSDAEILITGSANQFSANGAVNLGGVLRWQDARNWYKVLINGSVFQLLRAVNGKISVLAAKPFAAVGGTSYSIRFRALGSSLFAKTWPSAQAEPANWTFMLNDTQLATGVGGIRALLAPGAIVRVTSFIETSVPATM
jgi:hypothetical protein